MKIVSSSRFTGERAWQALDIADFEGTSVRLHWTDQPYKWHINDGQEVFAVMQGRVEMFYRVAGEEKSVMQRSAISFMPVSELNMSPIPAGKREF